MTAPPPSLQGQGFCVTELHLQMTQSVPNARSGRDLQTCLEPTETETGCKNKPIRSVEICLHHLQRLTWTSTSSTSLTSNSGFSPQVSVFAELKRCTENDNLWSFCIKVCFSSKISPRNRKLQQAKPLVLCLLMDARIHKDRLRQAADKISWSKTK